MGEKYRILLISPSLKKNGGVCEFNKMLLKYGYSKFTLFELKSSLFNNTIFKIISIFFDFLKFIFILINNKIDLVHVNPSLARNSIMRDGVFIIISKLFKKKVFVHWHGWNPENENLLDGNFLNFINKSFFKADHIKFLSTHFEKKFQSLGFKNKTSLGSTFVDDELININFKRTFKTNNINLLFLSTISKNKGIYLVIKIFKDLQKKYKNINLIVAGVGEELENIKDLVKKHNLKNISFTGHVKGAEKSFIYSKSHIYLFPSMYEGMPTTILEALCFGLPIVCSNVGAIPEIFEKENMGFMVDDKNDTNNYVIKIIDMLENRDLMNKMSNYNRNIGCTKYLASKRVNIIEKDYIKLFS